MGVAVVESHGTIAAACATVTVSRRGRLNIEKLLVVLDAGRVINPHTAAEQCEGSVCGSSRMPGPAARAEGGRFVNTNFDTYNCSASTSIRMSKRSSHRPAARSGAGSANLRATHASRRRQRDLLRDRQAHPLDAIPQPGSDVV